ncbi:hypothetical protein BBAD15_g6084 [Beauveria bassiana D1-5]|uniref:Uncharacterized protein n=1 Tax=Beauveria bassiana D1-5 TaxID=1245745 RepID=A0A0A2W6H1_BEABA|nr:hypothetical protein BBAD15_g6084 [Beauveria bassiana D1-5]
MRDAPFSMHCRRFFTPLWSQTQPRGHAQRGWARRRPSGDATGRALLRPSQRPSHRQVATKTRDDARPLQEASAGGLAVPASETAARMNRRISVSRTTLSSPPPKPQRPPAFRWPAKLRLNAGYATSSPSRQYRWTPCASAAPHTKGKKKLTQAPSYSLSLSLSFASFAAPLAQRAGREAVLTHLAWLVLKAFFLSAMNNMNNKNWNDRADKDLFFTILSIKNIGVISGAEWTHIGNYMRSIGYGFTNEGCRPHRLLLLPVCPLVPAYPTATSPHQYAVAVLHHQPYMQCNPGPIASFLGLRRATNKIEPAPPPADAALRRIDPSLNPITRRPGPGRGRPRKSAAAGEASAGPASAAVSSVTPLDPNMNASPTPAPAPPQAMDTEVHDPNQQIAMEDEQALVASAADVPYPGAAPVQQGAADGSADEHPSKRQRLDADVMDPESALDDEAVLALAAHNGTTPADYAE